jgi:hypothetical protein
MKKTIIYLSLIYIAIQNGLFAQTSYVPTDKYNLENNSQKEISNGYYLPVYYNLQKRQLLYNGSQKISGKQFLEMCRGINDSLIQEQLEIYDSYTRKKVGLTIGTIACGATAYCLFIGSIATMGTDISSTSLMMVSLPCLIATPICAIGSSFPHQKRKTILFHDLAMAYNHFVESNKNIKLPIATRTKKKDQ